MLKKILSFFKKSKQQDQEVSKSPYADVKVWYDDERAWVHWPSKEPQSIPWSALIGVAVETTDLGPFVEDVWWHLASKEKVITFPSEATGVGEMLTRLQKIPTFNNEHLIQAMQCTDNKTFILWDHEARHTEIYIICDIKTSTPIRIKLKGRTTQVAFTYKRVAEEYIKARNATELLKPINVREMELKDNMGIIIEDSDISTKLLTDLENFDTEKYYRNLYNLKTN
jgi:hypothetical protein